MRGFPADHRHLTRVVLKTISLTSNKSLDNSSNNLGFVLFVWKNISWQLTVYLATMRASKAWYSYTIGFSGFRTNNSKYTVIIFQRTAAYLTNWLLCIHQHILFSPIFLFIIIHRPKLRKITTKTHKKKSTNRLFHLLVLSICIYHSLTSSVVKVS